MKPLIGYGSGVSASRPARLVSDKTFTWTYGRHVGLVLRMELATCAASTAFFSTEATRDE